MLIELTFVESTYLHTRQTTITQKNKYIGAERIFNFGLFLT